MNRIATATPQPLARPTITVEFYGIPRQRAGAASICLEADEAGTSLASVLSQLAKAMPVLAESCFHGELLRSGYCANLNGDRFVSDPQTPLQPGDCLLILSADAGG
jgi:molybdopterin converting factor small subunit